MNRLLGTLLLSAAVLSAQAIDRTKPPATPPLSPYRLPPASQATLANGLQVVCVEDRRLPLVTVRMVFDAGAKHDPADLSGLAETTGALLKEGTGNNNSRELAERLADIGGSVTIDTNSDSIIVSANALAEHTSKLLAILADMVRNASFPADELALRKQNRRQELLAERSQSSVLAEERFVRAIFGLNPYGVMLPTAESIDRISRADLIKFRDRYIAPDGAYLIVVGDVARDALSGWVKDQFGSWKSKPDLDGSAPAMLYAARPQFLLVDRPGSVQADIVAGRLAVTRKSPEYFPLMLANGILGLGGSSRMFMDIREKRGYAYDAHSTLDARKDAGFVEVVTQVRNEVAGPALGAVFENMRDMSAKPPSSEEVENIKNFLSGLFVLRLETMEGVAGQLAIVKSQGLPNSYLESFVSNVQRVPPAAITEAARKYFAPEGAVVIVVGDAAHISQPLEKYGKFQVEKSK